MAKVKARGTAIARFNACNIGCDSEIFDALRDGEEVEIKDPDVASKLISRGIVEEVKSTNKKTIKKEGDK